jgi:acyl dehydratase
MPLTTDITGLQDRVGEHLGWSDWREITQERVDQFADATDDHQWIHVDRERAAAESPFGGTIAHGYLTLALVAPMLGELIHVDGVSMGINYGLDRVRFPAPVPVGSRVRASYRIVDVSEVEGGVQVTTAATVEREGSEKPVCVAETVSRYYR